MDINRTLVFRGLAVGIVLYWLGDIVLDFFRGGPEAPSLLLLILSIVVLGGGAVFIALDAWKLWKKSKKDQE